MAKEVPMMIINGKADKLIKFDGGKTQAPPAFGPRFFRMIYNCDVSVSERFLSIGDAIAQIVAQEVIHRGRRG
jgi:hypothetical protein